MKPEELKLIINDIINGYLQREEAALKYGISLKELNRYLAASCTVNSPYYDETFARLAPKSKQRSTMNKKVALEIAEFIIKGHTINEAVIHFGFSYRTIITYLKLIRDPQNPYYSYDIANNLTEALEKNKQNGKTIGGASGHKEKAISEEDALYLKNLRDTEGLSYRELSNRTGYNATTIYNTLNALGRGR